MFGGLRFDCSLILSGPAYLDSPPTQPQNLNTQLDSSLNCELFKFVAL